MTSYIPREFFSEYTLTDSIHFSHHFFPAEKWKEEIPFDTTISSYEADFYDLVFYPDSLTYDYLFNIEIHEYPDRIDIYRPMSDEQISGLMWRGNNSSNKIQKSERVIKDKGGYIILSPMR